MGNKIDMWEEKDVMLLHAKYFISGQNTVLGEVAAPHEIFASAQCGDLPVSYIVGKITVKYLYQYWDVEIIWRFCRNFVAAESPIQSEYCLRYKL
jgi:hypothetical protein